jgi:hypothetical protein
MTVKDVRRLLAAIPDDKNVAKILRARRPYERMRLAITGRPDGVGVS